MPLGVKLALGGVVVAITLSIAATTFVPKLIDPVENLVRAGKRMAQGPSSPADAKKIQDQFDAAVKSYLEKEGDAKSADLRAELQKLLPSNAFEVHVAELPRGLRIVEIDALLQANDYLIMKSGSGLKVFTLPGLEVFDDARILNDTAGPVLALLGHSGGTGPRRPTLRTYALLPDFIADETDKLVPPLRGEGTAKFDNSDVKLNVSLLSLFKSDNITVKGEPDEKVPLTFQWKDARYMPVWQHGNTPLSAVFTFAHSLKHPEYQPFYNKTLTAAGSAQTKEHPLNPLENLTVSRVTPTKYRLVAKNGEYTIELKNAKVGGWLIASAKMDTPVASAPTTSPGEQKSEQMPATADAGIVTPAQPQPAPPRPLQPTPQPAPQSSSPNAQPVRSSKQTADSLRQIVIGNKQYDLLAPKKSSQPSNTQLAMMPAPSPAPARTAHNLDILAGPSKRVQLPERNTHQATDKKPPLSSGSERKALEKKQSSQDKKAASAAAPAKPDKKRNASSVVAHGSISSSANHVRLRSEPSTSSSALTEIAKGTAIEIVGKEDGWYKVRHKGKTGYIYGPLVEVDVPQFVP